MIVWSVVTAGKRWSAVDGDGGRRLAVMVGAELREYWEEARGGPRVYVHQVGSCALECAPTAELPVCVKRPPAREGVPVPERYAPWVRALDDFELFEYLESGGYAS